MQESDKLYLDPRRITPGAMAKLQRGYRLVHGEIMTYDDLAIMNLGEAKEYLAVADKADITEALKLQDIETSAPRRRLSLLHRSRRRYILASAAGRV